MPPSHFLDLRLVRTNLDKEGLKFQLEEYVVAGILKAWGLQESHYHCEFQHCLCNNIRWIKKTVFNLKCTSVFHVFKLSTDYEELWKGKNQIPAVIIRCLQKVHKVRFTVVKAPNFSYTDLWWLHNFDFNFINHFTFQPLDTFPWKDNMSSRNFKLPTLKHYIDSCSSPWINSPLVGVIVWDDLHRWTKSRNT